jgi:hypothetical protein
MSFSDSVTVTINAVAKTLYRVNSGDRWTQYESAADGLRLKISHVIKGRASRMIRLDRTVLRADPITGLNTMVTDSAWMVYNSPAGLVVPLAEQEYLLEGLIAFANVEGNQDKFLNGES